MSCTVFVPLQRVASRRASSPQRTQPLPSRMVGDRLQDRLVVGAEVRLTGVLVVRRGRQDKPGKPGSWYGMLRGLVVSEWISGVCRCVSIGV
jgi:hypothetical protein